MRKIILVLMLLTTLSFPMKWILKDSISDGVVRINLFPTQPCTEILIVVRDPDNGLYNEIYYHTLRFPKPVNVKKLVPGLGEGRYVIELRWSSCVNEEPRRSQKVLYVLNRRKTFLSR